MSVGDFLLGGELQIRRLGFGTARVFNDHDEGLRVLKRVVELGVNFIDTADIYGPETSELLIAEALYPYPDGLVIATKGGMTPWDVERPRDGRPEYLRGACERSLARLRVERIDLYHFHRHDPEVPIEESLGVLDELRREGKIRLVGVSNVSVRQLERARAVTEIASVQNEYNRWLETSDEVLAVCEREGIAFLPWRPLGETPQEPERELRWLLERSPVMLPIPGTSSLEHAEQLFGWARNLD